MDLVILEGRLQPAVGTVAMVELAVTRPDMEVLNPGAVEVVAIQILVSMRAEREQPEKSY
jgi:hypothetical protein